LSVTERIAYVQQDRWTPYPEANKILETVEGWLSRPRKKRPQGLFILARSDNGKTDLLERIYNSRPIVTARQGPNIIAPILLFQAPEKGKETSVHTAVCTRLAYPLRNKATGLEFQLGAVDALRAAQTQVLMVDEIGHLLAGGLSSRRSFLNALKYISNELKINLIVAGTPSSAQLRSITDEVTNRLLPVGLPSWAQKPIEELGTFLSSVEQALPLRERSYLGKVSTVREVARHNMATIGRIVDFINRCAVDALESGKECITTEIIKRNEPGDEAAVADLQKRL
jgi:hypothetical protein